MSVFLFSTYELDSSSAHSTDLRIGKVLDNIVDSLNDLYWQETSKDFAGSTIGEAHVFIYEPKYRGANSVWEQDELPILKKKGIPVFEHRIDADGNIKVKQIHH